jgi:hypothetical protein
MRGICSSLQQRDHSLVQTIIRYASFCQAGVHRRSPQQASRRPKRRRLLVNVPEPGLDELTLLTIVAVPLIVPFAPVFVAVAVMTVILAAIIRAHIVLEGAVSLGLELVEIVRIHAHRLVGRQQHSRRRKLCTSPGATTAVDSMENSATAAAVLVAIR